MKNALKIIGGSILGITAGMVSYSLLNKKARRKAMNLKETMINEMKKDLKDVVK